MHDRIYLRALHMVPLIRARAAIIAIGRGTGQARSAGFIKIIFMRILQSWIARARETAESVGTARG